MKAAVTLIAMVMLTGCAISNFTPYEGAQNWPISQGALVDRKYALPVYYGPPPQPYILLGSLDISNATAGSEVSGAANEAKKLGADAIIVLKHGSSYAGTYSTGSATAYGAGNTATAYGTGISVPIMRGAATVAVIRWAAPQGNQARPRR